MNQDFALIDTPLTVSEINLLIKKTFEERFFNLSISGEISSFRPSGNGHWYFTMKDEKSQISAVMFRSMQYGLDFTPSNGDFVTVTGSIDVYSPRGTYQIICQSMKKAGEGALLAELEKRRSYYEGLGWFDQRKKKAIPEVPACIGVVTALTGAAIQDILNTTRRRAPGTDIVIYETLVQGESAAASIAAAIDMANEAPMCDVLIVGRGGGSIEDLLPFSDPLVIEAIHRSTLPIISAVGHEIDWAISDDVADRRAITPTDGAVIATEGIFSRREKLRTINDELNREMRRIVTAAENKLPDRAFLHLLIERKSNITLPSSDELKRILMQRASSAELRLSYASDGILEGLERKCSSADKLIKAAISDIRRQLPLLYRTRVTAFESVMMKIRSQEAVHTQDISQKLRLLSTEATSLMNIKLSESNAIVHSLVRELEALNPKNILQRGYSIVQNMDGKVVRDSKDVKNGEKLIITLYKGSIKAEAEGDNR